MGLNRNDLIKKMNGTSSEALREKGYVSFVDILIRMDKLSKEDYEAWHFRRVATRATNGVKRVDSDYFSEN